MNTDAVKALFREGERSMVVCVLPTLLQVNLVGTIDMGHVYEGALLIYNPVVATGEESGQRTFARVPGTEGPLVYDVTQLGAMARADGPTRTAYMDWLLIQERNARAARFNELALEAGTRLLQRAASSVAAREALTAVCGLNVRVSPDGDTSVSLEEQATCVHED